MKTKKPAGYLWKPAPTSLSHKGCTVLIWGDTGVGRTTWALSAPGPIALISTWEKIEGIVQPAASEKEVRVLEIKMHLSNDIKNNIAEATRWRQIFFDHLDEAFSWAKTIILDTTTGIYELIRVSEFGGLKPTSGRVETNYELVNSAMTSIFMRARMATNTNLIAIDEATDEWTKPSKGMGNKTGRRIRKGFARSEYLSDVVVRLFQKNSIFTSKIEKAWWNQQYLGVELSNDLSNFTSVLGLLTDGQIS